MAEHFNKGRQDGWFHDRGHWGGFFHTYPDFKVGGSEDTPRKVHIFLPRDYEVSGESYPTIYINDGHTAFFPGGEYRKTWNVGGVLSRLYLSNRIRKVIAVAVYPVDRDREYTHAPVYGCNWGGLDTYSTYLAQSVKGFIDDNYRTLPDAEQTLVIGAGHGGLAAFYTATQHPEKFRCVAALSPSFWVGLDSAMDFSLLNLLGPSMGALESSALMFSASKTLENPALRPKVYLDWGLVREGGFHNEFMEERATVRGREMRDLLVSNFGYRENENLFITEDAIGQHSEESWGGRLENILPLFFGI